MPDVPGRSDGIRVLSAAEAESSLDQLADILVDAVESGASVNFMLPFTRAEALAFWRPVLAGVAEAKLVLLGAFVDGTLVGTVSVAPVQKPNQPHRADLAKLLVKRSARGRGLGRALMQAAEAEALARGRPLVTFDTATGSPAERLYESMGYERAGVIPGYALFPDGALGDCTFFYKWLAPPAPRRA